MHIILTLAITVITVNATVKALSELHTRVTNMMKGRRGGFFNGDKT